MSNSVGRSRIVLVGDGFLEFLLRLTERTCELRQFRSAEEHEHGEGSLAQSALRFEELLNRAEAQAVECLAPAEVDT